MKDISISSVIRAMLEIGPKTIDDVDTAHSGIASDLKPFLYSAYQIILKFGKLENVNNLTEDLIAQKLPEILKFLADNRITTLDQFLHLCKLKKEDITKIKILLTSYLKTKNQHDFKLVAFSNLSYVVDDEETSRNKKNEILTQAELICKIVCELIKEREKATENNNLEVPYIITQKNSYYLITFGKYNTEIQVSKHVASKSNFRIVITANKGDEKKTIKIRDNGDYRQLVNTALGSIKAWFTSKSK